MSDLTLAASEYLSAGMHILALTGKRPNTAYHETWDWDNSIHGTPETDEDLAGLKDVFTDPTTTGIALLIPQHFLVADVDTPEAAALFQELAGTDPNEWETRTARTTNGLHLWYWAPGADRNLWVGGRTLLFKGFGGYVVAPPSAHFNAKGEQDGVYTWLGDWEPVDWLPDGIAERIKFQQALQNRNPATLPEGGLYLVPEMDERGRWTRRGWGRWNLDGLQRVIREAEEGNQNNIIAWAAMTARDKGVPLEVAMKTLLDAALEGHHPERRARATIWGAYKRAERG